MDNILISQLCASNGRFVTANIIDDVNNFSDHLAFCCSLGFENDIEVLLSNNTIDGNKYFYKYNWTIDARQKYYACTGDKLQVINNMYSSLECLSLPPENYINSLYDAVVNTLCDAAAPFYCKIVHKERVNFRWSHTLTYLKRKSREALNSWRNEGCPPNGISKEVLVSSRREYRKAVKNAKLDYKKQKAISLMHASKCKDSKVFGRHGINKIMSMLHYQLMILLCLQIHSRLIM